MGWMEYNDKEGNEYLWGDMPQDRMDNKLIELGGKNKKTPLKKKSDIFNQIYADKKLKKELNDLWIEKWERPLKDEEFKLHICFGLGSPEIPECKFYHSLKIREFP